MTNIRRSARRERGKDGKEYQGETGDDGIPSPPTFYALLLNLFTAPENRMDNTGLRSAAETDDVASVVDCECPADFATWQCPQIHSHSVVPANRMGFAAGSCAISYDLT